MRRARTIVLVGLAAFVGLVALAHPLRPGLPAADHFVSEYAKGSTAPLQIAAFLAWATAMGAAAWIAAGLGRLPGRPKARAIAVGGLGLAAAGCLLAAIFATQTIAGELPPGTPRTSAGRLHDAGSLLILAGLFAAAIASVRLIATRRYRLTVAALGVALLAIVPGLVALGLDAPGIGQRGFILIGCVLLWRFAATGEATARRYTATGRRERWPSG